jgi:SAM-dependent methyltransferase
MNLEDLFQGAAGKRLVDWGCLGWKLSAACKKHGIQLAGADLVEPANRPQGVEFFPILNGSADIPDGYADIVSCNHVIEHMSNPSELMHELMRIVKPGGALWIEAPSELAANGASSSDATDHSFMSFWDDPTHIRPWTPGALYRLAISHRCFPLEIDRAETGGIPVVRMHAIKPFDAPKDPQWRYVTLQGVPPGVHNAWVAIWGSPPTLTSPHPFATELTPA